MHSTKNFADAIRRAAEQGIAACREIVVKCPEHGEFSRDAIIKRSLDANICPDCYAAGQEAERRAGQIREAVRYFERHSGVPARFRDATFEGYQPQTAPAGAILTRLKGYADNFTKYQEKGISLLLCGKTGTGKTHLACSILRCLAHKHGIIGVYDTTYRAIQRVRATYSGDDESEQGAIVSYTLPDLLVLDEIGVQYGTDSERLILFSILNGRYEEMRPSILISNLTVPEIREYLGDRILDRLAENGGAILTFDWSSYRRRRA